MEYEKSVKELTFEKLTDDFSENDFVYNQKIYYTDIDFSNHTNNAVYIRHILNTFPSDFFGKHTVEDFEIHYLHETLEGDLLSVYRKESEGTADFLIKSGDNEVVRAKLTFKDN
jgi:acyl-ACP thioesterase